MNMFRKFKNWLDDEPHVFDDAPSNFEPSKPYIPSFVDIEAQYPLGTMRVVCHSYERFHVERYEHYGYNKSWFKWEWVYYTGNQAIIRNTIHECELWIHEFYRKEKESQELTEKSPEFIKAHPPVVILRP